ncbi:MAG: DUF2185 domain-containing protein [Oscillospiraceae bacterium]|nr:DUF2185 domain-containing protein [Oscillospiraceae bacterium]
MPHSSGGGSSSSYSSHSSSSHSSSYSSGPSRSSSSSHSSSSYSSSGPSRHSASSHSGAPKVSRTAFTGARKYVRTRNNVTQVIYADRDPSTYTGGAGVSLMETLTTLFLWGVAIIFGILVIAIVMSCIPEHKITAEYDRQIRIEDRADVLDNTGELMQSLQHFQDLTGITPAVVTVFDQDWQDQYSFLENYAYDLYVDSFSDEYHWLIVYSRPDKGPGSGWRFEGMQGDETDDLITDSVKSGFNLCLQMELDDPEISVAQAFTHAFNTAAADADERINVKFDPLMLFILLPFIPLALIPLGLLKLVKYLAANRYKGYKRAR